MSKPPRRAPIEALHHIPSLSDWTVSGVKSAVRQHSCGHMRLSSQLCDAMETEPRIFGPLARRIDALASRSALPFSVEASDEGDGRQREACRKRMAELWWKVCPETINTPVLRDGILAGGAVGYLTWAEGQQWIPRLHWLPTHGLALEQYGLDGTRGPQWIYTTYGGERLVVTPGDGFWFLHLPYGPRSFMRGLVRPLGMLYIMATWTERDWARYNEKHGLPILEIDEPFWAQDDIEGEDGSTSSAAAEYYEQFKNLESEAVLRSPQGQDKEQGGFRARWLEPVAQSYQAFRQQLEMADGLFQSVILGRDGGKRSKGGDGEANDEKVRVELLSTDAEGLSTSYRDQIWKPFALYNYGDPDVAGWGRWTTRPPQDLELRASTLDKFGDALEKLEAHGVDTEPLLEEFGLKRKPGYVQAAPVAQTLENPP